MAKIQVPASFDFSAVGEAGNAATALKKAGATKGEQIHMVPIESLSVLPGLNPRVAGSKSANEHILELSKSILANGFYPNEPLHVFVRKTEEGDQMYIRGGHHRFAAVQLANKKKPGTVEFVPVVIDSADMTEAEMTVAFKTGNTAKPLSMFENAILVQRLTDLGMTKKEIQASLSLSDRAVLDLGVLYTAPQEIIDLVTSETISATLAIEEIKAYGPEKAAKRLVKANAASPVADPITGKKKKVTKKAVAQANTDDDDGLGSDPSDVFEVDPIMDATLNAMVAVRDVLADASAEALMSIVENCGGDDLVAYAVASERYEEAGLVLIGLVELPEEEAPVENAGPVAADEPPAKPKRDRKKKEPVAAVDPDLVDQAAADPAEGL